MKEGGANLMEMKEGGREEGKEGGREGGRKGGANLKQKTTHRDSGIKTLAPFFLHIFEECWPPRIRQVGVPPSFAMSAVPQRK